MNKRKLSIVMGSIILLIAILLFASIPIRKKLSNHFTDLGDSYLLQKKFVTAALEYDKAITLNRKNQTAQTRNTLAAQSAADISLLEPFYTEKNVSAELDNFDKAKSVPKDEVAATTNSKELIEAEEYQLAIVAAKTATQLEPSYRDGWLYLGIASLKTAENVELPAATRAKYLDSAASALEKARLLDPQYKPTLDFIAELKKQR